MFKKVLTPIIMAVCLAFIFFANNFPLFYDYSDRLEVYSSLKSSGQMVNLNNTSTIFIHKSGEAFSVDISKFNLQEFLDEFNAQIEFTEEIDGGTCFYAYSNNIKYLEYINHTPINLHIFMGKQTVKVGSPLIYGGY